jgi:hypothetical protein
MAENRFKVFVGEVQSDVLRDFTLDAAADENLPDASSWQELEAYLISKPGVADGALDAARSVWNRYEAEILRKDR